MIPKYNKEDLEKLLEGHITYHNCCQNEAQRDIHKQRINEYSAMYFTLTGEHYQSKSALKKWD